jgi:hypothetical protein
MNDGGGSWEGFPSYEDRLARVEQQLGQEPASPAGRPREHELKPARPGRPCERELRELEAKNAENARLREELEAELKRRRLLEKRVAELERQLEVPKRPYHPIVPYWGAGPWDQRPGGPGFGP